MQMMAEKCFRPKCVALAPPPVYRPRSRSSGVSVPKDIQEAINIYINNQDCVPRMSLASIAKLLAMIRVVDALPLTAYEQVHCSKERSKRKKL